MKLDPRRPRPVATLEVTVEYDTIPDRDVLDAIVEHLNEDGRTIRANLDIPMPSVIDLLKT